MRFDGLIKILLYIATLYILVRKLIELVYLVELIESVSV